MLTGYGRTLPLSSCDFAFFSIDSSQQGLSARWLTAPAYLLQGWGLEQKEVLSPSGSSFTPRAVPLAALRPGPDR